MGSNEHEPRERAFLVGTELKSSRPLLPVEKSLDELALLADTGGLVVLGRAIQRFDHPHNATFIGPGKINEVRALAKQAKVDVIIFDDELSPRHQRELEKAFGEKFKVIDRTVLILDIFAQHAATREGMLQVELAQLEYRLPRLTRMWTHLARQGGGGGSVGLRGPGETQIEMDRRMIGRRLALLKVQLENVKAHRRRHRAQRQQTELMVVAIVGYTNAGKSTLLNKLSGADILAEDKLFATLDPTTRRVTMPGGRDVLFTDTVGFIQKLPTQLVAAFRATLEEIIEADIILHVADVTNDHLLVHVEVVEDMMAELEVETLPTVMAFNKMDLLAEEKRGVLEALSGNAVAVSAETGEGIDQLLAAIEAAAESYLKPLSVFLPYDRGDLRSLFFERGQVTSENANENGIQMIGRLSERLIPYFESYFVASAEVQKSDDA